MSNAFWLSGDELDDEQAQAVQGISETTSFLLRGPAGSGKTNILLLRAKWLTYRRLTDFKLIVFTSSLRQFIEEGCIQYGIDPASVVTQMRFFRDLLDENGVSYELTKNFEADRSTLSGKVMSLIDSKGIKQGYCDTLLVDEGQDYTDTELLVFRKLAKNLVLAADSRQSIYRTTHTPELPEQLVGGNVVNLRYHYRSGLKLCKAADAILAEKGTYPKIQGECRYPESSRPSSVALIACTTFDEQLSKICDNIKTQIDLYPNEKIGVLFPKKEQVIAFRNHVEIESIPDADNALRIDTIHGAKGWEFRAIHIGGAETLYRMGATQKRLIYTGILRGKTSVHIYFSGHLPGYLDAALATLEPPRSNPTLTDLFRK
jgi:superfamily I DNA and RNA helicase